MKTSADIQLKLKQTQQLNQSMQQSLRVLQLSNLDIEHEVEDWLAENPLLERSEEQETQFDPMRMTVDISSRGTLSLDDDDSSLWENLAQEETLKQFLHKQVSEYPLTPLQAARVHILIDFLDDKGYLTDTIEEIIEHTPLEWQLDEDSMEEALLLLREFEPAGIATANLQQSLLYQLDKLPMSPERRVAAEIVVNYLYCISQNIPKSVNRLSKLIPKSHLAVLRKAVEIIISLNPYPAYGFVNEERTQYIRPEIFVERTKNGWQAIINHDAVPKIKLNTELNEALQEIEDLDPVWREKINSAKQKLDMLALRQTTLMRVAEFVVSKQQDFFNFGEIALMPMLIKDCASALELAESTISRAVSNKYLACPQGIFSLRSFFSQSVTSDETSEGLSQAAIKSLISQMIRSEDKSKPLSDAEIYAKLQQQGINIARRTVAKYRELLGIASVQQRRL